MVGPPCTDVLPARPNERPIDELLTPVINRYLNQHKPVLARTDNAPSAFWLSSNDGAPMSYTAVERVIKVTTLSTVGVDVSPHLFRTSGASSAATHCGDNPHLASALLHHTHPGVANAHYNRAPSLSAVERLRQIVRQCENSRAERSRRSHQLNPSSVGKPKKTDFRSNTRNDSIA